MTRIAVMTDTMDRQARGTAGYARKLVEGIIPLAAASGDELTLAHSRRTGDPLYAQAKELMIPRIRVPKLTRFLSDGWFLATRRGRYDILHFPQESNAPVLRLTDAKVVVTVHSHLEGWKRFGLPSRYRQVRDLLTRDAARVAAFIAPSESTKQGIVAMGVAPEKVHVIPLAADPSFFEAPRKDEALKRVAALGVEGPYVYAPGRSDPQKNIPRIVEAFARAKKEGVLPHRLVIGARHRKDEDARVDAAIAAANLAAAVTILKEVPQELMPALYAGADAVLYPSLHEGFGLPILESMAAGTPVVTSAAYSMPEVAGDAALLVDPEDVGAIAAALSRVLTDPALAAGLAAHGKARAGEFSYARMAEQTFSVYQSLCR